MGKCGKCYKKRKHCRCVVFVKCREKRRCDPCDPCNFRSPCGNTGPTGPTGPSAPTNNGFFYLLQPSDVPSPIAPGGPIPFPNTGISAGVSRIDASHFNLPVPGIYDIFWQVPIVQTVQLAVAVNGIEQLQSRTGSPGNSQNVGGLEIQTYAANTILNVLNSSVSRNSATVISNFGGSGPSSGSLKIHQVA